MTTFMTSHKLLFTSESVTEGHPDKLCDQIADGVLDSCFEQDPMSRVACEVATKTGFVMLLGEITTNAFVNFDESDVVRHHLVQRIIRAYDEHKSRVETAKLPFPEESPKPGNGMHTPGSLPIADEHETGEQMVD